VADGQVTAVLQRGLAPGTDPNNASVEALAFNPTGTTLAVADHDGSIYLWGTGTNQVTGTLPGDIPMISLAFSPDGSQIVAQDIGGHIHLWDAATATIITTLSTLRSGQSGDEGRVAFSPDGHTIAAGLYDGSIRLWDSRTGKLLAKPVIAKNSIFCAAFSPD